jgi:polar amino acid transport system permease protein
MLEKILSILMELWPSVLFISEGVFVTLKYSITSVLFGSIIGVLLAICKVGSSSIIKNFADFYTSIFRGTPLLIQLSIIYYGLPPLLNIKISVFAGGVIAFSLNSGAYVSEIIKAGILAIDVGQFEAAKVLNIPKYYTYKDIILPQVLRNILPSLVNELIDMLKESSLISILGEIDLMHRAQLVAAEKYQYFMPMGIAACCYYILVLALTYFSRLLERRLAI